MRRFFQVDRILILVLGLAVAYLIGSHLLAQRNLSVVEGEKMSAEQRANASASDAEKVAEPVVELCSRGIKYPKNFRTEGYVSSPSRSCGCPALRVRRVSPALRVKQASPDLPVLPVLQDRLASLAKTARMEKTEHAARKGIGDPSANKVRQAKTHHPPSTSMTWVR